MSAPGPLPPRPPIRFLILAVLGFLNVAVWTLKALVDAPSTFGTLALVISAAFAGLAFWQWRKDVEQFRSSL